MGAQGFGSLDLFNAKLSSEEVVAGTQIPGGVGREGVCAVPKAMHCHHQGLILMSSDVTSSFVCVCVCVCACVLFHSFAEGYSRCGAKPLYHTAVTEPRLVLI